MEEEDKRGFLADLVLNAIEPGVNRSVLVFVNVVFGLLLATLVTMMVLFMGLNVHVIIMCLLATGLLVGFNWSVVSEAHQIRLIFFVSLSLQVYIKLT